MFCYPVKVIIFHKNDFSVLQTGKVIEFFIELIKELNKCKKIQFLLVADWCTVSGSDV